MNVPTTDVPTTDVLPTNARPKKGQDHPNPGSCFAERAAGGETRPATAPWAASQGSDDRVALSVERSDRGEDLLKSPVTRSPCARIHALARSDAGTPRDMIQSRFVGFRRQPTAHISYPVILFAAVALGSAGLFPAAASAGEVTETGAVGPHYELPRVSKKDASAILTQAQDAAQEGLDSLDEAAARLHASMIAVEKPVTGAQGAKSAFAVKRAKKTKGPSGPLRFPLPLDVMYSFGSRAPHTLDDAPKALESAVKFSRPLTVDQLTPTQCLEAMLNGCPPGFELELLAIMQSLDVLDQGQRYAQFLEAWRNSGSHGDESFYEALDRTAGTSEMVFFYDSMLGDFANKFAKEDSINWNLNERHDMNQQCFLTYRQYRGLVEATAWSLLLPPDQPLPHRIRRYDYDSVTPGAYSLRHQIDVLVGFHGSIEPVIEEMITFFHANPLPEKLWDAYDPTGAFGKAFKARIVEMTEQKELSTDELGDLARATRAKVAAVYHEAVESVLPK